MRLTLQFPTANDEMLRFTLDLDTGRWTSKQQVDEGKFPFVKELDGVRYEIRANNTFTVTGV